MAAGKISIQANDGKVAGIVFEDGASGNIAVTVPKDGGKLAADSTVVHKTGDETIAGVKTFSNSVVFNGGTSTYSGDILLGGANTRVIATAGASLPQYTWGGQENRTGIMCPANEQIYIKAIQGTYFTSGAFGYGTGAGGTVTQLTNKSTTVTLNKPCGQITMNNAALAGGVTAQFILYNSIISSTDKIDVWVVAGTGNLQSYSAWASSLNTNGLCYIEVQNKTTGTLSEPLVLGFSITKGATA